MTSWDIRSLTLDDLDTLADATGQVWGARMSADERAEMRTFLRDDTAFAASRADRPGDGIDGTFVHYVGGISLPGAPNTDVDFVTWVGVRPDARRRGALSTMMRHHWQDAVERGVSWSMLWASEPGIYGRFGYGVACHKAKASISSGAVADAAKPYLDGTDFELFPTVDEAGVAMLHTLWEQYATGRHGVPQWRSHAKTLASTRPGPETKTELAPALAVVTRDGTPTAAAVIMRDAKWDGGSPAGVIGTRIVVSASDEDRLVLAHYLTSFDLFTSTRFAFLHQNDPIVWAAGGPHNAGVQLSEGLWLKPIHLDKALASRTYSRPLDMVIALTDAVPGTASTVRLTVDEDGSSQCEPSTDATDLTLNAATVGALSLGAWAAPDVASRVTAGVFTVQEHTAGAMRQLADAAHSATPVDPLLMF